MRATFPGRLVAATVTRREIDELSIGTARPITGESKSAGSSENSARVVPMRRELAAVAGSLESADSSPTPGTGD